MTEDGLNRLKELEDKERADDITYNEKEELSVLREELGIEAPKGKGVVKAGKGPVARDDHKRDAAIFGAGVMTGLMLTKLMQELGLDLEDIGLPLNYDGGKVDARRVLAMLENAGVSESDMEPAMRKVLERLRDSK